MSRWSFTQHPASVNEGYLLHFRRAMGFGIDMLRGGLAVLIHAVFPFLFTRTASTIIGSLHDRMIVNRSPAGGAEASIASAARDELLIFPEAGGTGSPP